MNNRRNNNRARDEQLFDNSDTDHGLHLRQQKAQSKPRVPRGRHQYQQSSNGDNNSDFARLSSGDAEERVE